MVNLNITKIVSLLTIFFVSFSNAQDKPTVELHGALRFNYKLNFWDKELQKRGGDIAYDMLAINPKASYKGLTLEVKYRFYAEEYGRLLRQGDISYAFNDKDKLTFGLTKVPFGIEMYNSHSYFLSMGYYIGLEDDYDIGFKYMHKQNNLEYQLAFFKNSEDLGERRYSYDIVGDIKETNQLNGKFIYKIGEKYKQRIGTSFMYGGLLNTKTNEMGSHCAMALHYEGTINNFNVKLQGTSFRKNTKGTVNSDVVSLGAYNLKYDVASKGQLYTAGASYNFPIESKVLDYIQIYNDYNYFDKTNKEFKDSFSNTTGLLIAAGNIYSYVEFITAKNQPWFGGDWNSSFSTGNDKVQTMFNINVGYYF